MAHAGLNTICPVCGANVPEAMPPMEVSHGGHLDDRELPMLRVCSTTCARTVNHHAELYYHAAKANLKADHAG